MSSYTAEYLRELTSQIEHVQVCEQLQEIANQATAYVQEQIDSIEGEIEDLALQLVVPVDLTTTIIWIIGQIKPKYKAYLAYIEQLKEIVGAAEALIGAVNAAFNNIKNCEINVGLSVAVPTINIPTIESLNRGFNPLN